MFVALPVFNEHVVIKPVVDGRPTAQMAPVVQLHGLPQDVRAGAPVHLRGQDRGHRPSEPDRGEEFMTQHKEASGYVLVG